MGAPIRLRDFIEDTDGWLYAVSTYDNQEKVGCVLRYIPHSQGERMRQDGRRFHKLDFEEAYELIRRTKPAYANSVQRVPLEDVWQVYKPEEELTSICARNRKVHRLADLFTFPGGTLGCTGSFLCGLENEASDIDLVVYGKAWFSAQDQLRTLIREGVINDLSPEMWQRVYKKRQPAIPFEVFVLHEKRKWNRGEIEGTYFDLLYTRSYGDLENVPKGRGTVIDRRTIQARVTDASLAFDSPALYEVEHDEISRVLSFTHTYSGQALRGEIIEAKGVCEAHGSGKWLVVGTSRTAPDEYIISRSLMEQSLT
ncbi:MAG: nucleotidyltransferase domain-containing protein [Methanomicrobiales archaeon]|nr:nucleotidyltransferase domain-containing protein [Methanomicrobiales archaeon]